MRALSYSKHGKDLSGHLVCDYCNKTQPFTDGYDDNHWWRKVLPAIHCNHCLRNERGDYPTVYLQRQNQARRITNNPTDEQVAEFNLRVQGSKK